jgi:hypothetical protein
MSDEEQVVLEEITRHEVERRLKEGEDVLDLAIEKWVRIVNRHSNGLRVENGTYWVNCALCHQYYWEKDCKGCPLFESGDGCGVRGDSPFAVYFINQTLVTATNMLNTLRKLKEDKEDD